MIPHRTSVCRSVVHGGLARLLLLCFVVALAVALTHQMPRANASTVQGSLPVLATLPVGDGPRAIALDASRQRLYVANERSANLGIVDSASALVVGDYTLDAGMGGAQLVAVDRVLQRVFVVVGPRSGPHTVRTVDAREGRFLGTISTDLRIGGVATDSKLGRVFITGVRANASVGIPYLVVVGSADLQIEENLFMGVNDSAGISSPLLDECRGHVYLFETVRVLDPLFNIYDGASLRRIGVRRISVGLGTVVNGLALDLPRRRVATTWSNEPRQRDYAFFLGSGPGVDLPSAGPVAVDQRTALAYVASRVDVFDTRGDSPPPVGRLTAVDLDNRTIIDSVEIGRGPHALAIDEASSRVYVTNYADDTVTVVQGIEPATGTPLPTCDDVSDTSPFW